MWGESGVDPSSCGVDVGDVTLSTGNFFNLGELSVDVRWRVLVHRWVRVGFPVLTGGCVGEIDNSEVDLTALTWSGVMATFGGGPNHKVLAVGLTKRNGVRRTQGRVPIRFLTSGVRGLVDLQG